MARWKYTLKAGKDLREAISDDDNLRTLEMLEKCWREINAQFPDDFDEDDLQNELDDIENQKDNVENYEDYDMTEEDLQDEINYLLDNFYEYCDNTGIWVEI